MKLFDCVLACLVFLAAHPTRYQVNREAGSTETSKRELLDLENYWLQVEDDPSALESILASDFLHVVPVGIITKQEQLTFMRKHPAPSQRGERHFENMHVRVFGNVGIVNGVVVETGAVRQETLFTDVFAYREGKWQAVSAQELPAAPNAH